MSPSTKPPSHIPSDPYYLPWQLLAKVNRWAFVALSVAIVLAAVAARWFPRQEDARLLTVVVASIVALLALPLFARAGMPCPRCGKPYFQKLDERGAKTWHGNSLSRHCLNCALPLWAPGESSPPTGTSASK